jgi:putative hydrolase of the HAD superfamily
MRLIPFMRKYGERLPEDFADVFVPFYFETMYMTTTLKPETLEVLQTLKAEGYKLALLSNGDSFSQHNKIRKVGIEELFDEVVVSGDIGIDKPDRKIFDILTKRLGVRNEECMMVGDVFSSDILGAYNAGVLPVWIVTDPEKPAKYYTGYRISDLRELYAILKKENNGR